MSNANTIRREVSKHYARKLTEPGEAGCCGGLQKSEVSRKAGYDDAELEALPKAAVENSFGCGNPMAFAAVGEGETVLDLGSGAGIDLLLAARKVGPTGRVIGVDMTDEMIAKARENIADAGLGNIEVRKGVIEELPVEDASVDWVMSNCVICLSPDKPRVFAEIARVLRPGGRMVISDIVVEPLPEAVTAHASVREACIGGALSERDYLDGLRRAGLENPEVTERLVYDTAVIEGLIRSEGAVAKAAPDGEVAKIAELMAGRVWSAKLTARKPAG